MNKAAPMEWAEHGACVGEEPAMFFPAVGLTASRGSTGYPEDVMALPRRICGDCPVFTDCHNWALHHETEGIWAGTDPFQRRRLRRALKIPDPASLGRDEVHDETVGLVPPLDELDVNRSAAEVARAAGVSKRTVVRHRARRRNTA